ncbi:MAG: hypothetical protein ACK5HY_14580 [Parahaliea sp.]
MPALKRTHSVALALIGAGLIQSCAPLPGQGDTAAVTASSLEAPAVAPVPELTLHLSRDKHCQCAEEEKEGRDLTFLERGYDAIAQGDHIEAVKYFQSYQRLETSPEAAWEAGVAIAFVSMLPNSPFYEPEASRKSWKRLNKEFTPQMRRQVHPTSLVMRDALESFSAMERHISDLEDNNAILKEDLGKREEALKRLRALTLGQRGARQ